MSYSGNVESVAWLHQGKQRIRPWLQEYHSEIELVSCGGESGDDFVTSPGVISETSTVLPCRT